MPDQPFQLEERFTTHQHNGVDAPQVDFTDLVFTKQDAITAPTGGSVIDVEARTAINSIITALENLGLIEEN